ncbi:MAG: protein kinase [Polyangiaceae bacterium]|nr:protein kinase [Polyangiaceae bacterium]
MERIGPYLLERRLGGGGMGVVYAARHEVSAARVALKTLALQTPSLVASLRAEAAALSKLEHPGIVRVHEHGVHEGTPYLTMELLEGETLETAAKTLVFSRSRPLRSDPSAIGLSEVLEDETKRLATREQETRKLAPREAAPHKLAAVGPSSAASEKPRLLFDEAHMRRIAGITARIARALAYAHGEGIVHRDLKPDNIVVIGGDRPVLVDFGIARPRALVSRERLEIEREIVGTAAYVAPEQIFGEPPDPRSDLYALGCVFYRLLAERPPFVGSSAAAVLRGHVHERPAPPSTYVEGLPAEIDALVLALLAKDPRDRVPYAEDVARRIEALGLAPACTPDEPQARTYVYAPHCVGRSDEIGEVARAIDAAVGEVEGAAARGVVVTLAGESGVGKTRFVAEVVRACPRDVLVVAAESEPRGKGASGPARCVMEPLLATLLERAQGRDSRNVRRWVGPHAALLSLLAPELAAWAGDEAPPLPRPEQIGRATALALVDVVLTMSEDVPVLLALDDLQWADEITLAFVERLASDPRLGAARVAVLAAYRAEEADHGWLARGLPGAVHVRLRPLPQAAMVRAAGAMLALPDESLDHPVVHALVARASSSPFALVELTRLAALEGMLVRERGEWSLDPRATGLLEGIATGIGERIARTRLARLDDVARELVFALAVAGGRLAVDHALEVVLGPGSAPPAALEERAYSALAELVRESFVVESAPGEVSIAHDKLREAATLELPPARAAELHGRVAAVLIAASDDSAEREAEIAYHLERAGESAASSRHYVAAAERFEQRGAVAPSLACWRAALSAAGDEGKPERRVAAARLGAALVSLGQVDEGAPLLDEARVSAEGAGDLATLAAALVGLAYAAYLRGEGQALLERASRAVELAAEVGDDRLHGRAENVLGIAHGSSGRFRRAIGHYERAAELAERSGDVASLGKHRSNISINWRLLGELDRALEAARAAVSLTVKSATSHANAWSNLGRVYLERAQLAEARSAFERAIEVASKLDYAVVLVEATWGLAEIARRAGDRGEARRLAEAVLALAQARGYAVSQGQAMRTLALIDLEEVGDPLVDPRARQAVARLEQSVETIAPTQEKDELADGLSELAAGLLRVGELERAAARRAEAVAIYRELGMVGRLKALGAQ